MLNSCSQKQKPVLFPVSANSAAVAEIVRDHPVVYSLRKFRTFFRNCRGCHNLADMYNAKNPMVAKMHAGFIDKPTNCIMCHKTAGHNYKMADEIIKATGKWPDPAKAWEQADAAAKK